MKNTIMTLVAIVAIGLVVVPRLPISWDNGNNPPPVPVPPDPQPKPPEPSPIPVPSELFGFDVSVPPTLTDKSIASVISGVCGGLADRIVADGVRQEPFLKYVAHINDLRLGALDLSLDGVKVKDKCPNFGPVIAPVFAREFPDGTVLLTPALRSRASAVFKALEYVCKVKVK